MIPSLVYRVKRRRLVALMLLVLFLVTGAAVFGPGMQPAGEIHAEHIGKDGIAAVLTEPGGRYRISYRELGPWKESDAFTGEVLATCGGPRLAVIHGREISLYKPSEAGKPMLRDRGVDFPHHWNVLAAASAPGSTWAFGTIDGRTLVAAWAEGDWDSKSWTQGPELRRPADPSQLTASAAESGAFLWWRENSETWGASFNRTGWGEPRKFDVPAAALITSATREGVPTLFALTDRNARQVPLAAFPSTGPPWSTTLTNDAPAFRQIDSASAADGVSPEILVSRGWGAANAAVAPALDVSLSLLDSTFLRTRQHVIWWSFSLVFAACGILGIGVTLLFEPRKISEAAAIEQAKMLLAVAPLPARAMAFIIDFFPFFLASNAALLATGNPFALFGVFALGCTYHAVFEGLWNQSLGKMIAGVAVRRLDGSPAGWGSVLIRNAVRFFEYPVLPALVCMISTKRSQRIGDLLAGTMVARVEKKEDGGEEERPE